MMPEIDTGAQAAVSGTRHQGTGVPARRLGLHSADASQGATDGKTSRTAVVKLQHAVQYLRVVPQHEVQHHF